MIIQHAIALLAPQGVCMPPPLFIDLLFVHCIANMKWKNGFTKFFIAGKGVGCRVWA
jgi:hypothetical protein